VLTHKKCCVTQILEGVFVGRQDTGLTVNNTDDVKNKFIFVDALTIFYE
jgi:hypothetical protein